MVQRPPPPRVPEDLRSLSHACARASWADVEARAAAWLVRRDQPEWSATDDEALRVWLSESDAHKVALWRLETGWEATARLAALKGHLVHAPLTPDRDLQPA